MVARVARDAGVRALLIKGPASAELGLRDSSHQSVDVDVWVAPQDLDRYCAHLFSLGWRRPFVPTSSQITPRHAVTMTHPNWPCELDVHDRYPGLLREPIPLFEYLWAHRQEIVIAHEHVWCPDLTAMFAIESLHRLRAGKREDSSLSRLITRYRVEIGKTAGNHLNELAVETHSVPTLQPILRMLGCGRSEKPPMGAELLAWEVGLKAPNVRSIPTLMTLLRTPKRKWISVIGRALVLSEVEIRRTCPELALGRRSLLVARMRRVLAAVFDLPRALWTIRQVRKRIEVTGGSNL